MSRVVQMIESMMMMMLMERLKTVGLLMEGLTMESELGQM